MRGPAYASRSGPPLAGVGGGATRLPWRLSVFVLPAAASAAMATPQPQPQPCRPKPSACRTPLLPESRLQVKVVGLFKSSSFQMSKTIAEVTLTPQSLRARQPPVSVPPALAGPRSTFRLGECVGV